MSNTKTNEQYVQYLESGFFGFWVKNWRISILTIFLVLFLGTSALISIPKESTPDIKFGIISISTIYPGVNPTDIDNIITQKIEKEIKDIEGIKKISSVSAVGSSSTTVELENGVDTSKIINDIKDKIDVLTFPDDVEDPRVQEISTNNELLFRVALYGPEAQYPLDSLKNKAIDLVNTLEGKNDIVEITLGGGGFGPVTSRGSKQVYEYRVLVNKVKADQLGITLAEIAGAIRSYNRNQPLGSHTIANLNYDFRVQGEIQSEQELMNTPVRSVKNSILKLGDIATVKKTYANNTMSKIALYQKSGFNSVELTFYKKVGTNVFTVAEKTRKSIAELLAKPAYNNLSVAYTFDLADNISEDYDDLAANGWQTVLLVFLVAWLFIGFRESLITTLSFPLALFVTFFYLNSQGLSLNFMTNFSLILTFGMGIDTVMVVIESAYENVKKGFEPKNAVLIAVKDYAAPLIASALANIIVFLPMIFLPGLVGKFLAYIPQTIFATLIASLFFALTINCAIFYLVTRSRKVLIVDPETGESSYKGVYLQTENEDQLMTAEDTALLEHDRQGKIQISGQSYNTKDKVLDDISALYANSLKGIINSRFRRIAWIVAPVILLILTFVFLSPQIGFKLFPSGDNALINVSIIAPDGTDDKALEPVVRQLEGIITDIPELRYAQIAIAGNQINLNYVLLKKDERYDQGLRDSFKVEEELQQKLSIFQSQGFKVESSVQAGGPPVGKAIGIQLVSDSNLKLDELIQTSRIFENYIKSLPGAENVSNSSSQTPGQFVFRFDNQELKRLGLVPSQMLPDLYLALNGLKAGTIKGSYDEHDISIKYELFENKVSPQDVMGLRVNTPRGPILVSSVADYTFDPGISSIRREGGNVIVNIEADVIPSVFPSELQTKINKYADDYQYPIGISSVPKGENSGENADLIQATLVSFVVAVCLIFVILVLQFNSFAQPAIILYVIVLALIGVNIGLYVTGNPYSMPFGIGFISLVGIIVNNAIVLIDKINSNREKGVPGDIAVVEAGKSRLRSIVISTISTIAGIGTVVFQDEFWAGLGVTVIAGLLVCTILTLYVIPSLYYEFFLKPSSEKIVRNWMVNTIIKPIKNRVSQGLSRTAATIKSRIRSSKNKEKNS